jgi:hypothetical protein
MNADGSGQTKVTDCPCEYEDEGDLMPAWSPDGNKIAFSRAYLAAWGRDIVVMNPDGSGQTKLTNGGGENNRPAWSPDGSKIAFQRITAKDFLEIYVINVDGSGQANLTNRDGSEEWTPAWSPDGSKIAFTSDRDVNHEVYVMDADGSGQTNLTKHPGNDCCPAWSPDGSQLAFYSTRDGNSELYVMNTDGSGQTNLSNHPTPDGTGSAGPAWSPDGNQIAFSATRDGNREIYVMNADGSGQTNLTNNPAYDWYPSWRPIPLNQAPVIDAANSLVAVLEGQSAGNTGTVSDPDGDAVALAASIGTVLNNGDGTWSWSFDTSDGPAESQTVTITADDGNGGVAQVTFDLTVNNVTPTVGAITLPPEPVALSDQPVNASATFSDPAGPADEPYTCTVDYGDGAGAQAGTVAGTACNGPGHTYAEAGIYTVTVSVTDKDGDSGTRASDAFVVIYDPDGGFVTGGGWIDSPQGAYKPDPSVAGKATFGFVSKYKRGASTPTGNTEFQFKAADLNFHSNSYQWLVVTQGGSRAQFKGEGTINGASDLNGAPYKFMLWAGDGDPDTFRIRIWWEDAGGSETDVYDNGFDQAIGGGSIVVHTKKR